MKIQLSSDDQSLMHTIAVELDDILAMNGLEDFLQIGDIEDLDCDTQVLTKVMLTAVESPKVLLAALNKEYFLSNLAEVLHSYALIGINIHLITETNQEIMLPSSSNNIAENIQAYIQANDEEVATC